MNLVRHIVLFAVVAVAVAATPVALGGNPTSAESNALEIRGQALNQACLDPTHSREAYRALCTYTGAQSQLTAAELNALEIRGQALNQACLDPTHSREPFRGLCTYVGTQTQPTSVAGQSSTGFDWGDFGIGAGAAFGLALLFAGTAAAVHYSRRSSVRPRTVS